MANSTILLVCSDFQARKALTESLKKQGDPIKVCRTKVYALGLLRQNPQQFGQLIVVASQNHRKNKHVVSDISLEKFILSWKTVSEKNNGRPLLMVYADSNFRNKVLNLGANAFAGLEELAKLGEEDK